MKRAYIAILSASLIANAALLVALGGRHAHSVRSTAESSAAAATPSAASPAATLQPGPLAAAMAAEAALRSGPHSPKPLSWADLESSDMRTLAANLRAAGLSERMVFTIVAALVRQQSMAKTREIMLGSGPEPFWKTGPAAFFDGAKMKQVMEVQRQERELMTSLFGTGAINENDRELWEQRFGPLSPDKLQKLMALNSDYSEMTMAAGGFGLGPQMPWDREQRVKLEQQKRQDIEALLTPDELQTYDLYSSSTAMTMRRQLAGFAPTEAEFRTVYDLRKAFDDKYSYNLINDNPDLGMQRMTAQKELDAQIKSALGDARYADYTRSTDLGYQTAVSISQRLNLPPENATAVYALQQDMQRRAAETRSLPPDTRAGAMRDLATEASAKLSTLLTPQGVEAYKNRGGSWLRSLERQPSALRVAPKG